MLIIRFRTISWTEKNLMKRENKYIFHKKSKAIFCTMNWFDKRYFHTMKLNDEHFFH